MGYQLPGIGNIAFASFSALGKQQTTDSKRPKKGKDRGGHGSSSAAAAGASAAARPCKGRLLERGFLRRWRQELRPLLNSLRFVESSNRENCPDGDAGASIGPLQISRQYHSDAWRNTPVIAWSQCRDLDHAESTVIAYWLKYCPEAVKRHDFETLAKIHNGGPQGPQREKTEYYWSKVDQHLKQQEASVKERMKENTMCGFSPNLKHAKQEGPSKVYGRSPSVLSPITTNAMPSSKHVKSPANCATTPKLQTPKPKVFQCSLPAGGKAQEKESSANLSRSSVKHGITKIGQDISCRSTNKRVRQTSYFQLNASLECVSLRHALNLGYWKLPPSYRREKAAVVIQAFWRMRCVRGQYTRMQNAAVLIQRRWKRNFYVLARKQRIQLSKTQGNKGTTIPCSSAKCTTPGAGKQGDNTRAVESPCELLYRGNISANQEDALLTELASLLNWDTKNATVESCHSFRFPHSEETNEACTPKMKPELRWYSADSPHSSEEGREKEPRCTALPCVESTPLVIKEPRHAALPCVESTPLVIKEALLSPLMEKEIIAELANLFPPYMWEKSHKDIPAAHSLPSCHEGTVAEASKATENSELSVSYDEQSGKDEIIRKLTFGSTEDEGHRGDNDEKHAFAMDVSFLKGHGKAGFMQSSFSTSEDYCVTGSDCFGSEVECDEEELRHINVPLLADQSPVPMSKTGRMRKQNPCNRKIEKALVSSLSEWQCSASFEDENQDQASRKGLKVDVSMDVPSSLMCRALGTSKEFFLCSLTSASDIQCKLPFQQARPVDKPTEEDDCTPTQALDILHPDCLLETSDVRNSTVYAKAFFQCMNFSLHEFEQKADVADELVEKRKIKCHFNRRESGSFIASTSYTGITSLQHLCILWDKHSVDLLTRSLKYKSLQAVNCDHQQAHPALRAMDVPNADGVMDIDLEIQHLERLPRKFKNDKTEGELVLHQRDIIYTNIAAYCDMQERHRLYDKWRIEKLLTGRLKKIVYELLWIDPERCQESAELVIQYL